MTTFFDSFDRTSENNNHGLIHLYLKPSEPQVPLTAQIRNDTEFYNRFYFDKFYSSSFNIAVLIIFCAYIIFVIGSNLLVIHGILDIQRKVYSDFYMISLATIDTFVGILVIPPMCLVFLQGYFPLGTKLCNVWIFLDYYLIVSGSWGFAGLMLNYLWMMTWPTTYKTASSKRHLSIIGACYVLSLLAWLPPFLRLNDDNDIRGICGYSVIEHKFFSLYIGIFGLYIPGIFCISSALWCSWCLYLFRTTDRIFLGDLVQPRGGHQAPIFLIKVFPMEKELNGALDYMELANLHFPASMLLLFNFLASRCAFYVYFMTGAFVQNFLARDLGNGVYWIMHSFALTSPICHLIADSELRANIMRLLGLRRPQVEPTSAIQLF